MANDIIAKCITGNVIDNGGIVISASQLASQYQIDTYSSQLPATGTVYNKYDARFTGVAPCQGCGEDAVVEAVENGVFGVIFV